MARGIICLGVSNFYKNGINYETQFKKGTYTAYKVHKQACIHLFATYVSYKLKEGIKYSKMKGGSSIFLATASLLLHY